MLIDSRSNRSRRVLSGIAGLLSLTGLALAQQPATEPVAPKAEPAAKPDLKSVEAPKTEAPKAKKADPSLPAGKEIVAKFVDATGGKAAYEKVKTRRAAGTVDIPSIGLKGTVTILSAAPGKMRFTMDLPQVGPSEEATDGQDVWSSNSVTGPSLAEGDEREQFLVSATFNPELHLDDIYTAIDTTGTEKVGDQDSYVVEFTPKKGSAETRYYGKESKLLLKTATVAKTAMGEITTELTPGDWKDVDGVKQPHSMTMKQMGMEMKVTFEKIEHNVDLPADTFAMPAEIKALKDKGAAEKKDESKKEESMPAAAPAGEKKEPSTGGSN